MGEFDKELDSVRDHGDEARDSRDAERANELVTKALEGAAAETVQRFGVAAREHFVAYEGVDRVLGFASKGLREISQSKVNPESSKQNLRQQAGFSAEVKSVARKNARAIIDGSDNRFVRTDSIGRVNDPLFDVVEIGQDGSILPGSFSQVKFVGNNPEELLSKLCSKKYAKYLEHDAILDIPDDYYDALFGNGTKDSGLIEKKIRELDGQIDRARSQGKADVVAEKMARKKDLQKIKKSIRKSGLTRGDYKEGEHVLGTERDEAMEARLHPRISTAKDVVNLAHEAGKQQAKTGAIASGSISLVKNVVACAKGEIEPDEAAGQVARDVGSGAVKSYAIAFSGTAIQGAMSNASSEYVRALSKTNLASGLVTTTISVGKTMRKYIAGEISGAECIEELGEKGFGELGAAMYSAVALSAVSGTSSIAVKMVAGMAGSALGYAAAVAVYQELVNSQREYDLARSERLRIEQECAEAVELICQYRAEMNRAAELYFQEKRDLLSSGFSAMDDAIVDGDVNGYLMGNALIQRALGREAQFQTMEEFDDLMLSDQAFQL